MCEPSARGCYGDSTDCPHRPGKKATGPQSQRQRGINHVTTNFRNFSQTCRCFFVAARPVGVGRTAHPQAASRRALGAREPRAWRRLLHSLRQRWLMLRRLATVPARYPFAFGVGISTCKTGAADYITQIYVERRETIDRRRSAVFLLWGAAYLGGVQYFLYVHLFSRVLFPSAAAFVAKPLSARLADRAGQATVLKQVALDQFIHHPLMVFPCFYVVKELIEDGSRGLGASARSGLAKYARNAREDLAVCWRTWIPAFLFNFSVCPIWARIPFVAAVSFGFTAYFSLLRGAPETGEGEEGSAPACEADSARVACAEVRGDGRLEGEGRIRQE